MSAKAEPRPLILASGSRTRREMLAAAGLAFEVVPADVDEIAIRDRFMSANPNWRPQDVAIALARAKAEDVSRRRPEALVIGSDQILSLGNRLMHKTTNLSEARENLILMRGAQHELHSAVALAEAGQVTATRTDSAQLRMRNFSDQFLDSYLLQAGEKCLESVGVYQIESLGSQLFERIEGDHFTILGMPLLPLLDEFRTRGVLLI